MSNKNRFSDSSAKCYSQALYELASEEKNLTSSLLFRVEQIVDQRLDELTPVQVKNIIQEMIRKHLGWLVVWGGVVGGFIGIGVSII